jgi:synaptojanin
LQEKSKDLLRIIASDHRYFWNLNLYKDFRDQNVDPRWFTPIIQGFVGVTFGKLAGRDITLGLISRRSHLRVGTRFHARGIDDNGNVANFVETEQIIQADHIVYSYTMLRGSVPVFWEQKGVTENVSLTRGPEHQKKAFTKHFDDLISTYGPI